MTVGLARRMMVIACVAGVSVLCGLKADCQEGLFEDLKLELKVEPLEVLVGQAVRLTVTLSNPTQVAVEGHDHIFRNIGLCEVYVAEAGAEMRRVHPLAPHVDFPDYPTMALPPGYRQTEDLALWLQIDGENGAVPVFRRPGRFSLQVVLPKGREDARIGSDTLSISVLEPEGRDLEAWQCVETEQTRSGRFPLYWDDEWTRAFVASFTDSSYAPYGLYGISMRTDSWPDVPESLHALEEALAYPGFALRPDVLYDLVLSYLHRVELHANTLRKEAPDSVLTKDVRETLKHALASWRYP